MQAAPLVPRHHLYSSGRRTGAEPRCEHIKSYTLPRWEDIKSWILPRREGIKSWILPRREDINSCTLPRWEDIKSYTLPRWEDIKSCIHWTSLRRYACIQRYKDIYSPVTFKIVHRNLSWWRSIHCNGSRWHTLIHWILLRDRHWYTGSCWEIDNDTLDLVDRDTLIHWIWLRDTYWYTASLRDTHNTLDLVDRCTLIHWI